MCINCKRLFSRSFPHAENGTLSKGVYVNYFNNFYLIVVFHSLLSIYDKSWIHDMLKYIWTDNKILLIEKREYKYINLHKKTEM